MLPPRLDAELVRRHAVIAVTRVIADSDDDLDGVDPDVAEVVAVLALINACMARLPRAVGNLRGDWCTWADIGDRVGVPAEQLRHLVYAQHPEHEWRCRACDAVFVDDIADWVLGSHKPGCPLDGVALDDRPVPPAT